MPSWYRDPAAPQPNVPRRFGVAALIQRGDTVLVERRADDADVWAFVAGRLEDGETILDGLRREVREETGLEVADARLLGLFSDPSRVVAYPDGTICQVVSIVFRVAASDGDPRPSEESAGMRFVTRDELAELPFWPAQIPVRDAFLADPAAPVVA